LLEDNDEDRNEFKNNKLVINKTDIDENRKQNKLPISPLKPKS